MINVIKVRRTHPDSTIESQSSPARLKTSWNGTRRDVLQENPDPVVKRHAKVKELRL